MIPASSIVVVHHEIAFQTLTYVYRLTSLKLVGNDSGK